MLSSKDIRLVPIEKRHLDDIMRDWNAPEMRKFLDGFIPHTREHEREWIENMQIEMKKDPALYLSSNNCTLRNS
jgi:hypothetical protein